MTAPWRRFPDVPRLLVGLLLQRHGSGAAGIETPPNLHQLTRFVRVMRVGGASDAVNDYAHVEFDWFAPTYTALDEMSQRDHQWLLGGGLRHGAAVVDRVTCEQAPTEMPWAPGMRRFNGIYEIVSRRHPA